MGEQPFQFIYFMYFPIAPFAAIVFTLLFRLIMAYGGVFMCVVLVKMY